MVVAYEKEVLSDRSWLPLFVCCKRRGRCRLKALRFAGERRFAYTGPWQSLRRAGYRENPHSGKTFLVDRNAPGSACWVRTGWLAIIPDASARFAKAVDLWKSSRVAVESRWNNKPPALAGGHWQKYTPFWFQNVVSYRCVPSVSHWRSMSLCDRDEDENGLYCQQRWASRGRWPEWCL